jgi:hypothetical protein
LIADEILVGRGGIGVLFFVIECFFNLDKNVNSRNAFSDWATFFKHIPALGRQQAQDCAVGKK